eukprot:gnl/TRDRNA2_/TRDRNA2_126999_c1_seq2.p1 gnl/TRDRNA2_/TRDRNA2_126999_c1~~gnl/TRDRNA2_/TRDRNA2_126999_c1_seq2.p1  ORF type:complete len:386 (+),score=28.42 gnl/TRDRNA2_/TRDRNA2_126999_c1_seq2:62-1159(+)
MCPEDRWDGAWSAWRQHLAEVILLQKFLTAPPGVLVDDPTTADIILVPILSQFVSTWFMFKQRERFCPRFFLEFLKHYTIPQTYGVHVFLFADHSSALPFHDPGGLNTLFAQEHTIFLSYGSEIGTSRHITIPSMIMDPDLLQPEPVEQKPRDIFILYSETVDCCHPVRRALYEALNSDLGHFICGTSCVVYPRYRASEYASVETHGLGTTSATDFNDAMRRAVFCPMGPGNYPHRVKLFHAILAGCIPVVFEFDSFLSGFKSWWKFFGAPHQFNVPFHDDVVYDFVVRVPCRENFTYASHALLFRLRDMPDEEIRARQDAMRKSRHLLAYNWNGSGPDAFTAIMERIGDFVNADKASSKYQMPS